MSRPLRIEYPDAWYYVMNRARRPEVICRDQEDYLDFMAILREASTMWNVQIAGFCLMPTQYHLLVQTPDANLARFMRHVDGVYTQRFNRSHDCDGSLFRGRYKAILVDAHTYLLELLKYIHRNPLRDGLVRRLDRYRWSSHKGYLSRSRDWGWLHKEFALSMLTKAKQKQVAAYRAFMVEAESDALTALFSQRNIPPVLGSERFISRVKTKVENLRGKQEIPASLLPAPGLEAIKSAVCADYKVSQGQLLSSTRGVTNQARNVAMYLSRRLSGETLAIIGQAFELNNYSSVSSVVSRMKIEIQRDSRLRRRVEKLERRLNVSQR